MISLKGQKSTTAQGPASSAFDEPETLSYEELQALDDIELANVVIFGNKNFRPLQHQACKASLGKRDCFVLNFLCLLEVVKACVTRSGFFLSLSSLSISLYKCLN